MPAPRKPSPSSPGTDRRQPASQAITRAEALRWWRAGYQAGHQAAEHEQHSAARWDQLVTSYRAQHAADQQAKTDVLLLEVIDVLARLLNGDHPGNSTT
jgi:pyruvate-formate lyase